MQDTICRSLIHQSPEIAVSLRLPWNFTVAGIQRPLAPFSVWSFILCLPTFEQSHSVTLENALLSQYGSPIHPIIAPPFTNPAKLLSSCYYLHPKSLNLQWGVEYSISGFTWMHYDIFPSYTSCFLNKSIIKH